MTFRNERRYDEHEGYHRVPHPDFTEEALAAQKRAFLKAGGKVQLIPNGANTEPEPLYNNATRRKMRGPDIVYGKKPKEEL